MLTLRSNKIVIIGFVCIFLTTLYFFYPSDHFSSPHAPGDAYDEYEAGGIDSDHWREPIRPKLEKEVARDEECGEESCEVESGPAGGRGVEAASERVMARPKKGEAKKQGVGMVEASVLEGGVIMPKLENATANGMACTASDDPSIPRNDRTALKSYFQLFARLYPCGECAEEFQALLKQYPPQTSSRKTASMWLCSVHNRINERLGKAEFDCLTLNEVYDCGCGPEGDEVKSGEGEKAEEAIKEKATPADTQPHSPGGKNVGEESKEAAPAPIPMAEKVKAEGDTTAPKIEKEEIIYNPPQRDKGAKGNRPPVKVAEPIPTDEAGEEYEEEKEVMVPTELSGVDEEAEEDDSGEAEGAVEGGGKEKVLGRRAEGDDLDE